MLQAGGGPPSWQVLTQYISGAGNWLDVSAGVLNIKWTNNGNVKFSSEAGFLRLDTAGFTGDIAPGDTAHVVNGLITGKN